MTRGSESSPAVVIGVGTIHRGDDGVGSEVARAVRTRGCLASVHELDGEPLSLMEAWRDADTAIVIDAVAPVHDGEAPPMPGRLHRFDASDAPLPAVHRGSNSTHGLGLADAVELARAMGQLPRRLIVLGIEGDTFEPGASVTPAVRAAIEAAADAVQCALEAVAPRSEPSHGE